MTGSSCIPGQPQVAARINTEATLDCLHRKITLWQQYYLEDLLADSFKRDLGAGQPLGGCLPVVTAWPGGAPPAAPTLSELYPLQLGPASLSRVHPWTPVKQRITRVSACANNLRVWSQAGQDEQPQQPQHPQPCPKCTLLGLALAICHTA